MKFKVFLEISTLLLFPLLISPNITIRTEIKVKQKTKNVYHHTKSKELKRIEKNDGKLNSLSFSKITKSIEKIWQKIRWKRFLNNSVMYLDSVGLFVTNEIEFKIIKR